MFVLVDLGSSLWWSLGVVKLLHILLKVYLLIDKAEIKCMGPVGGKHQQNQKCICSSLSLSIVSKTKLMDNKIMSVAFKHLLDQIAQPNGKIIYLYLCFYIYIYLPKIECATF